MTTVTAHGIVYGGESITFSVERTARRKTVAISVGYDGVRVLAPTDMDDEQVFAIVQRRGPWVLRKRAGYQELGGAPIFREFVSGETFHYLGRPYRLKVISDTTAVVSRVIARGSTFVAPILPDLGSDLKRVAVRSGLRHWYRAHAKLQFPIRAKVLAAALGIAAPVVNIVDQSKRWGSCDVHGHLRLNWRLVMAPMSLIDYVIAHEVCHVLEHNHSRRFWRQLEIILPDYESRARQLDRLGHLYIW